MKCIFLLLSISLYSCINLNETAVIYNGELGDKVFTESGIVATDTIRIMFDDYIPRFDSYPAYVDYGGQSPIILNDFYEPLLFENEQSLFSYMYLRGYNYTELQTFMINRKYVSAWVFLKY